MGLTRSLNRAGFGGRLFGVAQGAFAPGMFSLFNNRAMFGPITSVPQGYNDPQRAIRMTFGVGGNISARFEGVAEMDAALTAIGNMAGVMDGEFEMTAEGNVGLNGYATFAGEFDMVGGITAIGSMSANMDLIARPSANDIAQEVWSVQSGAFLAPGTTGKKLADAKAAADLAAALSA